MNNFLHLGVFLGWSFRVRYVYSSVSGGRVQTWQHDSSDANSGARLRGEGWRCTPRVGLLALGERLQARETESAVETPELVRQFGSPVEPFCGCGMKEVRKADDWSKPSKG